MPTTHETLRPPRTIESARPLCSGGASSAATAPATGVKTAAPRAPSTLAPSSHENEGASAAATFARAKRTRAEISNRRRATRPVTATSSGEPTA